MIRTMDPKAQMDLFAPFPEPGRTMVDIPGLVYVRNFLACKKQAELLTQVDAGVWLTDLRRRVQHYGYRYDYRARSVDEGLHLGPLPSWLGELATALAEAFFDGAVPNQVIANEYLPGQGISSHVDCIKCFGGIVASLSFGSTCTMQFLQPHEQSRHILLLEPGSLLVMSGEARYRWQHAIPARKKDITPDGQVHVRRRRVSLTFRTVQHGR